MPSTRIVDLPVTTAPSVSAITNIYDGADKQITLLLLAGLPFRSAVKTLVPADGSALVAVTFATPFPTNCLGIMLTVKNVFQTNPWLLVCQYDSETVSGFNLNVAGAPAGNTVSVFYLAFGN